MVLTSIYSSLIKQENPKFRDKEWLGLGPCDPSSLHSSDPWVHLWLLRSLPLGRKLSLQVPLLASNIMLLLESSLRRQR